MWVTFVLGGVKEQPVCHWAWCLTTICHVLRSTFSAGAQITLHTIKHLQCFHLVYSIDIESEAHDWLIKMFIKF